MKKTKSLRVALGMLALTLITSCFVGGTFAKYTTKGTATDSARVAKFGVNINANGSLFKTTYDTDDTTVKDEIALSVQSSNDDKVVAPGTTNGDKLNFGLTGTPEVAVKVEVAVASDHKDVVLKAGTYDDPTKVIANGKFTLSEDYHPLRFTLTNKKSETETETVLNKGTLDDLLEKLNAISGNFAPGTDLSTVFGGYTLTWEWAFENVIVGDTDNQIVDAADTYLGNLMAEKLENSDFVVPEGTSLDVAFDLTIKVTQID